MIKENRLQAELVNLSSRRAASNAEPCEMDGDALRALLPVLRRMYDGVQLVSFGAHDSLSLRADGSLDCCGRRCYSHWNRQEPCANCAARLALHCGRSASKLELLENELYLVTAICLQVDGRPCALELSNRVSSEELASWQGGGSNEGSREYIDAATGLRNHRYYQEQMRAQQDVSAVAMLRLNGFARVIEAYGKLEGDRVLRNVGATVASCVRQSDALLRYGVEDFLLVFQSLPRDVLASKLERIRQCVEELRFDGCPGLRLKVSVGGMCGPGGLEDLVDGAGARMRASGGEDCAVDDGRWEASGA